MILTATFKPEHVKPMSDEELFMFCQDNKHLRIERNAQQQILFMSPTGLYTSKKNVDLYGIVLDWNKKKQEGVIFDSNAGFYLPNGALRCPDIAWMSNEKWNSISESAKSKFGYVVPEFVVELVSPSDLITDVKNKMVEWIENGVQLAWMIEPENKSVTIYRANGEIETMTNETQLINGENVLVGFEVELKALV